MSANDLVVLRRCAPFEGTLVWTRFLRSRLPVISYLNNFFCVQIWCPRLPRIHGGDGRGWTTRQSHGTKSQGTTASRLVRTFVVAVCSVAALTFFHWASLLEACPFYMTRSTASFSIACSNRSFSAFLVRTYPVYMYFCALLNPTTWTWAS